MKPKRFRTRARLEQIIKEKDEMLTEKNRQITFFNEMIVSLAIKTGLDYKKMDTLSVMIEIEKMLAQGKFIKADQ